VLPLKNVALGMTEILPLSTMLGEEKTVKLEKDGYTCKMKRRREAYL
jgi:hypothetical protein